MDRQLTKSEAIPENVGKDIEESGSLNIPSDVDLVEYSNQETTDFSSEIKRDLIEKARDIISVVEKKLNNKLHWRLQLFPPRSEKEIGRRRMLIDEELGGRYDQEDIDEMKKFGLSLGGFKTKEEDNKKARDFLLNREMKRRGLLEPLIEGYVILDLDGKQITIQRNKYAIKYIGVATFEKVIDYLTK